MNKISRLLTAAAALTLLVLFVAPIWHIGLTAPQYPEGLGLVIRIGSIAGDTPNDLGNINMLNHYIGMRPIEPDEFPELDVLPWLVGALVVSGLAVAMIGRRPLLWAWVGSLALLGALGMADMWRWGYEYGHDLDVENAVIKVPGMTYQPPLVGTKQLLNFRASSWPAGGGIAAGVALVLGAAALVLSRRRGMPAAAAGAALIAAACAGGAAPIQYGAENCEYCRMTISDPRYGARLVNESGKTKAFDSIECLTSYYLSVIERGAPRSIEVSDFQRPGTYLDAERAAYLRGGRASPMGLSLAAFASVAAAEEMRSSLGADASVLVWTDVLRLVEGERRSAEPASEIVGAR